MWLGCLLLLCGVLIAATWWRGPQFGLGCAVIVSLLAPVWVDWNAGPLPIDLRTAIAVIGISAYCVYPGSRVNLRLVPADVALIALMLANLATDTYNDGFTWALPLRVYGEWGIPYVAGRLAIQSLDDARKLAPIVCLVLAALAIWALAEATTGVNPANAIFGERPDDFTNKHMQRFGLYRAEGPTRHSIYLGMLLVLLSPWVVYQSLRAWRHEAVGAWLIAPIFVLGGLVASTARSPMLALALAAAIALWYCLPAWRRWIGGGYLAALLLLALLWKPAIALLERLEDNRDSRARVKVVVGNERVEYSGTRHRLYLLPVYAQAMRKAGAFGFGTYLTAQFPLRIPLATDDAATRIAMMFVDNHYILIELRLGYVGLACFVAFVVAVAIQAMRLVNRSSAPESTFMAALGSAVLGVSIMLLTVWLPQDFGFLYLWTAGTTSGLLLGGRSAGAFAQTSGRHGAASAYGSSSGKPRMAV
ncbi:MAG TPA: O-antigen ligase family protein [Pirellulales bacterium]|nr:O-antigen ligase family protein [Pirellulales bacterium]